MTIPRLALTERLIVRQVKLFIETFKADLDLFDTLFDEDLTEDELQEWKDFYAGIEDIPVLHAFPTVDTRMPMIHVLPGSGKVSHPAISNHVMEEFDDLETQLESTKGEYWNHNLSIVCWTKNATTTLLLHHFIRVALVSSLDYFNSEGMLDNLLSETPLSPHTEFSPNLIYSRGFELSTKTLIPHTTINTDLIDMITVTDLVNINDNC